MASEAFKARIRRAKAELWHAQECLNREVTTCCGCNRLKPDHKDEWQKAQEIDHMINRLDRWASGGNADG